MASIWKQSHSKYFTACFRDVTGRQRRISTKETNRRQAQMIADEYEKASRKKRTFEQLRKTLERLHEELCPNDSLQESSLQSFCDRWLKSKQRTTADSTFEFYTGIVAKLVKFFGPDIPISAITYEQLIDFRDSQISKIATSTLNHDLTGVKMIFKAARRDKFIVENVAEFVEPVRKGRSEPGSGRRAFTVQEIQIVLSVCDPEWQSLVKLGLYSGQRLSDVALLRWCNIDFTRAELRLQTQKTGTHVCIPLTGALQTHLLSLTSSDDPLSFLHPRAANYLLKNNKSTVLSQQFAQILIQAGLRDPRAEINGRRTQNSLSFHSLRHTCVSMLKDAGVPQSVAMAFAGHSSEQVSQLYTHVGAESLRKAVEALPVI